MVKLYKYKQLFKIVVTNQDKCDTECKTDNSISNYYFENNILQLVIHVEITYKNVGINKD